MNHITIELCEADRDRIDCLIIKVGELIDRLPARVNISAPIKAPEVAEDEALQQIVENGTEQPQGATEAAAPTVDTTPEEKKPTAPEKTAPKVTLEQIQHKVIQLCTADGGTKKAKAREIINTYGAKVSDLKEQPDKWAEVWDKLTALEGEATA